MHDKEDSYGRATVALTRAIQHTYLLSPVDMAGLPGMAQVLAVFHTGFYIPSARVKCGHMEQRLSLLIRLRF